MKRNHRSLQLELEALEPRCVPAGNVTVRPFQTLEIIGDEHHNDIEMHILADGVLLKSGADATTINGAAEPLVLKQFFSDGFRIQLNEGNDRISIFGSPGPRGEVPWFFFDNSLIDTGVGDDVVRLQGLLDLDRGFLTVLTDNGNDLVEVIDFETPVLEIFTGAGDDTVRFRGNGAAPGGLLVHLGQGDDLLEGDLDSQNRFSAEFLVAEGGKGNDVARHLGYFDVPVLEITGLEDALDP